jgi:soluble lytic murein transglycosylase
MRKWFAVALLIGGTLSQAGGADAPGARLAPVEAIVAEAARRVAAGEPRAAFEALEALPAEKIHPAVQPQVDLLFGILLLREGRAKEAIPRLERASTAHPLLGDYALWHLAGAHRKSGQQASAALALQSLVERHPESLLRERANRDLPRTWLEAGDLARAEKTAEQYLTAFPRGSGQAEVWTTLGEVFLQSGRTERAEEVLRRVWVELPGSPENQRAKALLGTIPNARPFTPDEQYQRAAALYHLGRYGQAQAEMAPFAAAGNPKERQARLLLGISSFRLRQYAQSIQWLQPLRQEGTGDQTEVLYWLARSYGRSGDSTRFSEHMTLLADTAPQTRRAEEGLYLLGQAAADDGEAELARSFLTRLLKEHLRSVWADSALWLQGWLAYKARDFGEAIAQWDRLLAEEQGSPLSIPTAYWRGRALEAEKKPGEAVEAYRAILQRAPEQAYYWFRARERLAHLSRKTPYPAPAAGPGGAAPKGTDTIRAKKGRALRALGLTDDAVEEFSEQVRTQPEDRNGLAEACHAFLDVERYDKAVWLAGQTLRPIFAQAGGRPPIRDFWHCLYPRGFWSLVTEQAGQHGLDPFLVTALIREESAFASRAVSSAGARGLTQLMPQTAEQVARQYGMAFSGAASLEKPEVNIRIGTIHLAELIRENGGTLSLALAGYNAGQQHVRRWRDRYGFTDEEEFIEDIPYAETRNYVKRVLGSYQRYATLYGSKRADRDRDGDREPRRKNRKAPSAGKQDDSTGRRAPRR